jgi:hypothetical protein
MKIALLSESPADQAGLAVFTQALLGGSNEFIEDLEAHGVTGVIKTLGGVIKGLHYNHDADGLVVVVDRDETPMHDEPHAAAGGADDRCRLCQLRAITQKALSELKPRFGKPAIKVAIGLAVPAIEAWYRVGGNHQVGEAAWIAGCNSNNRPFTVDHLKKEVYGTERPSLELETACAVTEARRIIADIAAIESRFPIGFGLMAEQIRAWRA